MKGRGSDKDSPSFKKWEALLQTKGIREAEEAFVFGKKVTAEAARELKTTGRLLGWIGTKSMFSGSLKQEVESFFVSEGQFDRLDIFGTHSPILWIKIAKISSIEFFALEKNEVALVLPFQNPDNAGALLRSAAAFGVRKILLSEECAHPFHPKSVRAASGAWLHLEFFRGPKLADMVLPKASCIGLSAEGSSIDRFKWPQSGILVPGIEGPGLPENLRREIQLVSIPMSAGVESLNGMVATSLALYEWRKFLAK